MGTHDTFSSLTPLSKIFNFPLKIFAADKMKIALCIAVLIAVPVSAPGTWDNLGKTLDRTVNDLIPKTEEERERDALNYAKEDALDFFNDLLSGGGDCLGDSDCNAYLGYC